MPLLILVYNASHMRANLRASFRAEDHGIPAINNIPMRGIIAPEKTIEPNT